MSRLLSKMINKIGNSSINRKSKHCLGLFLFSIFFLISNVIIGQENEYSLEELQKDLTANNFTSIEKHESWIRLKGLNLMADDYSRFYVSVKLYEYFGNKNQLDKKYYYGDLLGIYAKYTSRINPDVAIAGVMTATYENYMVKNYSRAKIHEDTGLKLVDSIYGKSNDSYITFLSGSASTNTMLNNYPESKKKYFELLSLSVNHDDNYHENLTGLASCYSALFDFDKAQRITRISYEYFQKKYGNENEFTIDSEISLLQLYLYDNELDSLKRHISTTNFETRAKHLNSSYKLLANFELACYYALNAENTLILNLSNKEQVLKDVQKSEKYISQIESSIKKESNQGLAIDLEHDLELVKGLNEYLKFSNKSVDFKSENFGTLLLQFCFNLRDKNFDQSGIDLMELIKDRQTYIDSYLTFIPYEQISKLKGSQSRYFTTLPFDYQKEIPKTDETLKKNIINSWLDFKGKLDISIKQQNRILNSIENQELVVLNREVISLENSFYAEIRSKNPDELKVMQIEDSIDYFNQEKLKFIQNKFIKPYCDVETIQKSLRLDEIYIEIVRTEGKLNFNDATINSDSSGYYFFSITKNDISDIIFKDISPEKENEILTLYRSNLKTDFNLLSNPDVRFILNTIWSPINELAKNYQSIILSVDGIYNNINLSVLPISESNYLINDYRINLTYSGHSFIDSRISSKQFNSNNAILIGNPNFSLKNTIREDNVSSNNERNWKGWTTVQQLPETFTEIKKIENVIENLNWNTIVYSGDSATSDRLLGIQSPRVLHIATHELFQFLPRLNRPVSKRHFHWPSDLINMTTSTYTPLTYTYQVTSYDAGTQIATTVYTPSIATLPDITLPVTITQGMTTAEMQVAISEKAPYSTWWELDPSTKPPAPPGQWAVIPA